MSDEVIKCDKFTLHIATKWAAKSRKIPNPLQTYICISRTSASIVCRRFDGDLLAEGKREQSVANDWEPPLWGSITPKRKTMGAKDSRPSCISYEDAVKRGMYAFEVMEFFVHNSHFGGWHRL